MKLQPGTVVTPNVRLESHLADGAMGAVWVAEHTTLNTKVAVKFISDRLDPDDEEVFERFVREASTAAQIKSSHVVQTFDQGVMRDGTPYIVMEYLEGVELSERLVREGLMPLPEVVRIIAQTAKALQSAHKVGIIHRDIKPDNIFLSTRDDELHVKVFDFGIAKIRHPQLHDALEVDITAQLDAHGTKMGLTNDGAILGTPEFMSPEAVMSASNVDHHADLWGLAVVAYVCLVGELPFKGEDVGELCVNLLDCKFKPVSELRPDVPPELDDFFDIALSRNVEDRFQSARDLAQALAAAVPSASIPHGDALLTSGAWDARPSARQALSSLSGEETSVSLVGLKSDSISGATADADRLMGRRWSPSTVGGAVAAVLLVGGVTAFFMAGNGEPETGTVLPAGPVASSRAVAAPSPEPADEEKGEELEEESEAEPAASASASAMSPEASAAPKKPRVAPPYIPRRRRGPKDPGF